jgi:hypothetical protein
MRRTTCGKAPLKLGLIATADLEDSTQLFVEQGVEYLVFRLSKVIEGDVGTASTSKHHLSNSGKQTTIGSIVVGEDNLLLVELPQSIKEVTDDLDIANIGSFVSNLSEGLSKSRTAHSTETLGKINKDKNRLANLFDTAQLRCPCAADILNQAKG